MEFNNNSIETFSNSEVSQIINNENSHTLSSLQSEKSALDNPYCRLSNFEIIKRIGKGQFSVVYKAVCKLNNQPVALKKVQVLTCPLNFPLEHLSVFETDNTRF